MAEVVPNEQVPSGPGEKEVVRLHDARRVLPLGRILDLNGALLEKSILNHGHDGRSRS
jgi:hypothetical protein